jgi:general secretion pathway protein D
MELITSTIQPTSWDEVGGPGSIAEFATNLSLVISQTQEVHEQIVDLLEQLRRLQDLQVTIEVRFITLNDNFFEQIGVDLQIEIPNSATPAQVAAAPGGGSVAVGLQPPAAGAPFPNFTSNLDIPFNQSSFSLAAPQFGQPVQVASFGFAILSDIEAFFLVNASQGDRRSNVLQAPKVTLFNGQQAFVSDTTQTPFVISVVPVVGDFAAANQPVIVVLNEGTFLTVQAVISNDRRFVRLTVVPFFSQIGNVQEFTFSGNSSTTNNTSTSSGKTAGGDTTSSNSDDKTTTNNGITVQLPSFSFVTVTTTVSVPDGGTVLLGGIKRLSEGRNEFGVPILSKLPYINRLFKNVGIGRETQSLMMMVTPRIIIQEEEEDRLGIAAP